MSVRPKKRGPRAASPHVTVAQTKRARRRRAIDADAARSAAHEYCLLHYGTGYVGGAPRRLALCEQELWIVPVVLTSPGYGAVGEVGLVAIEVESGSVAGASSPLEVRAAGTRLAQEKRHELDAAFHRARTV